MRSLLLFFFLLFMLSAQAQSKLFPVSTIAVQQDGRKLKNPWAGGFNAPQFSSIDLNGDSKKDLFAFDRDGEKVVTFLNNSSSGTPEFIYAPQYQDYFPAMDRLALVRDYNCDGVADIFSGATAGLKLYKGQRSGSAFTFTVVDSPITYRDGAFNVNIYVANGDIPAIADVDGDGDLDILTFSIFGQAIEYYRNRAHEAGRCDTVMYDFTESCWGKFLEDAVNNTLSLGACKTSGPPRGGSPRHAGSSVAVFDQNNDKDVEAVLGDLSYGNLVCGFNGGDSSFADMTSLDSLFPSYDRSLNLPVFPAAFFVDVDDDGRDDMIAAPNTPGGSLNVGNVWYYKGVGPSNNKRFSFQTDSFLVGDMIDVGEESHPVFFDYNSDGLQDILVSNYGYYRRSTGLLYGMMALYQNVGTPDTPRFRIVTRDYMNASSFNLNSMFPSFGDIDADGDVDMIMGEEQGTLNLFMNTPSGGIANFLATAPAFSLAGIDIGQYSKPCLYDVDSDHDLDIIVGQKDGKLSCFWNYGDSVTSRFHADSVVYSFGRVDVRDPLYTEGMSAPYVSRADTGSELFLMVGSERGTIAQYRINQDSLRRGAFTMITRKWKNVDEGYNASLSVSDLNRDGIPEYAIGNMRGGVTLYSFADWDTILTPDTLLSVDEVISEPSAVLIYPNPALNSARVISVEDAIEEITLNDLCGRQIFNVKGLHTLQYDLPLSELSSGVYICSVRTSKGVLSKRLFRQ